VGESVDSIQVPESSRRHDKTGQSMGFDPSKAKMSAEEKKSDARARAEGARTRAAIINWLTDKITDPSSPLTTEEMNHLRMVGVYFSEGREIADKIDRMFSDEPELRKELYLTTIVSCLDRLLNDSPSAKQPAPVKTLRLASG
jgi:hypothetical protein